mgnify:CR=1 FL=1
MNNNFATTKLNILKANFMPSFKGFYNRQGEFVIFWLLYIIYMRGAKCEGRITSHSSL